MKNSFYKKTIILDNLIDKNKVSHHDFILLREIIAHKPLAKYFFFHLKNKEWFSLLYNTDELISILNSDSNVDDSYTLQFYICEYILKCLPDYQNEIVEIIRKTSTKNVRVYWKFFQIGKQLDPQNTAKLISKVETWIKENRLDTTLIASEIKGWFNHLMEGNQEKAALRLLRILSTPKVQKPTEKQSKEYERVFGKERSKALPVFDIYWMKKLLSEGIEKLIHNYPVASAEILQRSLERAIRIEYRRHVKEKNDLSYIWRAAIEDHNQNFEHYDYKETLLVALRNALEIGVKRNKSIERDKINELLKHDYSIFNRLGIHLIRVSDKKYLSIAKRLIKDKAYYQDATYVHEFYLMVRDLYSLFNKKEQESIFKIILSTKQFREDDKPENQEAQMKHWHWERLNFLKNYLKGEVKNYFDELTKEFSDSKFRDTAVWHESGFGEKSPIDANKLGKKNNKDFWKFLQNYRGFESGFDRPSIEGLAREFTAVVENDPNRFLEQDLSILTKLYPTYAYHFLGKIESLIRSGKILDEFQSIQKILDFIDLIIRVENVPDYFLRDDGLRLNFKSVKKRAMDVMQALIKVNKDKFSIEYKDKVWDIVEYLCFTDAEGLDDTSEEQNTNMDPLTVSLNRVTGSAMHLLLDYALWYTYHTKSKYDGQTDPNRLEDEQRVWDIFEYKLNDKVEKPTLQRLAVHSTFGLFIPNLSYLNKNWLIQNLGKIFPEEEKYDLYWNAAFSGFLYVSRFYSDLFKLLRRQFQRAIDHVKNGKELFGSGIGQGPLESVSQYIVIANYHQLDEKVSSKKSLLNQLITMENNEHIIHLVQFISNLARDEKVFEKNEEFWVTCKNLWRIRIREAKKIRREPTNDYEEDKIDQEFGRYTNWLESFPSYEKFPNIYTLLKQTIQLNRKGWHLPDLVAFLSEQSKEYPLESIRLLHELMKTDAPRHFFHGKEDEMKILLNNAINTKNKEAINKADMIMNRFGEWGNFAFKDLWMDRIYHRK